MTEVDELDTLLNEIGMGKWQVMGLVANFLIWTVLSPHTIGTTLLNAPVPFECLSEHPEHPEIEYFNKNKTEYETLPESGIDGMNLTSIYKSVCLEEHLVVTDNTKTNIDIDIHNSTLHIDIFNPLLPSCPYIRYDRSLFTSTVTTEWHLVCEQSAMRTLFQNAYTIGLIIGCFVGGSVGDRLGRARAVLFGSFIHAVATVTVAFATNFSLLLIGRFVVGLTNLMILVPVVTLSMETCPEKFRGPIGMLVGLPYSIGVVLFAGVGVFLRNWRHLYIATSFHALLLVPVAWVLDESPRWLLQVGRLDDAKTIITKAAKINGRKMNSSEKIESILKKVLKKETESKLNKEEKFEATFLQKLRTNLSNLGNTLKYPAMRKISIICPTVWFMNEVVYYATIFNANTFSSDNPFLYVALIGVADGLGIFLGIVGNYFGRKLTVAGCQFVSGSLLLLVLAIPDELKWLQWIFVMTGFLMCACASQALFVFTPELFPTTVRARGFAFSNLTGYTGTLFAPFIPDFLAQYGWWVTGTIVGSFGLISCAMISCLVETNHLPLCETIQDVEKREKEYFNKKKKLTKCKENGSCKTISTIAETQLQNSGSGKSGNGISNEAFTPDKDL
ncbi:UNVERIFIED_CONTAM: hypothetical protein RMT77_009907 [Armadillidium vulgare]